MDLILPSLIIAGLIGLAAYAAFETVTGVGAIAEAERMGLGDEAIGGILMNTLVWAAGALLCAGVAGFIAGRL